jgi:3-hydroxyacyl-CoA dehydrogenase
VPAQFDLLEKMVAKFQRTSMAIKHAQVPVVAAVQGMALGGGCEFAMHAAHRVIALESYIGLVEAGVGLIPAGGGSKEFAFRRTRWRSGAAGGDVFPYIQKPPSRPSPWRPWRRARWRRRQLGFAAERTTIVVQRQRDALCRDHACARAGRVGLAPRRCRRASHRGRAQRHRHLRNDAGEHGRRRLHFGARLRRVAQGGGDGAVRRRGRHQPAVERAVDPETSSASSVRRTAARPRRPSSASQHMLETGKPLRN